MTSTRSVIFATPIRTAIGTFGGSLKDIPAPDLGAIAVRAAVERAEVKPEEISTAVLGNVVRAGTKMNPARQATIHAGMPVSVPAMTVNRVCSSRAQAIVSAAQEIVLGNIDVAVAGGMENMDLAPYLVPRARRDRLNDAFSDAHAGWHTEDLVEKFQISRDAQDRWAWRSQQRFSQAQADGKFVSEIVPVERDEHNRPGTTLEARAAKPAFREGGTITAGNTPGLNSAAAAMVVADEPWAERRGVAPMARLVSYGIAAVEPGMFGLGPIPAVKTSLSDRSSVPGRCASTKNGPRRSLPSLTRSRSTLMRRSRAARSFVD